MPKKKKQAKQKQKNFKREEDPSILEKQWIEGGNVQVIGEN